MSRHLMVAGCALAAVIALSFPLRGSAIIVGPAQDLKTVLPGGEGLQIATTTTVYYQVLDSHGRILLQGTVSYPDTQTISGLSVPVSGVTYVESPGGTFSDDLVLTTIDGIDLDPDGSALILTGVDAQQPQFSTSGETIIGNSGMLYTSTFATETPIGNLAQVLGPGFDLSPFAEGDPSSDVYVFQTIVPAADIETSGVPEPATWVLCVSGVMLVWLCSSWHRRTSWRRRI